MKSEEEPYPSLYTPLYRRDIPNQPPLRLGEVFVLSPEDGNFYCSQMPGGPDFVEKGSRVPNNTVIGVVERFKIFYEVNVPECLIEDIIEPDLTKVERGQPLARITLINEI